MNKTLKAHGVGREILATKDLEHMNIPAGKYTFTEYTTHEPNDMVGSGVDFWERTTRPDPTLNSEGHLLFP